MATTSTFFLVLFYSAVILWTIAWTMWQSVQILVEREGTSLLHMFLALYSQSLAAFVGMVVTTFFGFHCFLLARNMTTIEFCEKHSDAMGMGPPSNEAVSSGGHGSKFDMGIYANVCAALGSSPLCWLLPFQQPEGDGLVFISERTHLSVTTDDWQKPSLPTRPGGGGGDAGGLVVQGRVLASP